MQKSIDRLIRNRAPRLSPIDRWTRQSINQYEKSIDRCKNRSIARSRQVIADRSMDPPIDQSIRKIDRSIDPIIDTLFNACVREKGAWSRTNASLWTYGGQRQLNEIDDKQKYTSVSVKPADLQIHVVLPSLTSEIAKP